MYSVDAKSEALVNEAIARILHKANTTVIIIAHRLSSLKNAHKIVVLEDGIISESGSFDQLTRGNSRFRKLMAEQLSTLSHKDEVIVNNSPPKLQ